MVILMSEEQHTMSESVPERPVWPALWRGMRQKCPACGTGSIYVAYLKVADRCPRCDEELHHHRADDAPPYFTMIIVGHIVVAGIMTLEKAYKPESWVHAIIWVPLLLIMSLWLLPRVKGALVGLQWALRMHGFEQAAVKSGTPPLPRQNTL